MMNAKSNQAQDKNVVLTFSGVLCVPDLVLKLKIARFKTQVQIGMVFDILSGNRFPFLVESTIIHPPLCATQKLKGKKVPVILHYMLPISILHYI